MSCARVRAMLSWSARLASVLAVILLSACKRGSSEQSGWRAMQPGMELRLESHGGPQGEPALALLYTITTGQDYALERDLPIAGLEGPARLTLQAKCTRVLHLAVVLVDQRGVEHECASTLAAGGWRELVFDTFDPLVSEWNDIAAVRLVDRTGGLGGQGFVSLKVVGLFL